MPLIAAILALFHYEDEQVPKKEILDYKPTAAILNRLATNVPSR
jgi:hypothetical protein